MRGLQGKVVIIAGAGGGIGEATAERLAEEGASVVVADIVKDNAYAVAESLRAFGGTALPVAYDQSDEESIRDLIATTVEQFGKLDAVHANAADLGAALRDTDARTVPLEVFDREVAVNQRGALLLTRYAVPHLVTSQGAIVYTSSASLYLAEPERVGFAMTKIASHALMHHVASRWGKEGVRANVVAPGLVLTQTVRDGLPPEHLDERIHEGRSTRLGEPADIAALVAFLISDDGSWINGQTIAVDGGLTIS
ncbi:SDR family NAD(P)-dependent oxidoreductase [Nocardia amamiensis]|uniref:SDR family NAD(P)-dependent oxidoreductase n=1 Tax=Nocardia amamiensis TaxID=404578 RepID=UPI0033D3AB52